MWVQKQFVSSVRRRTKVFGLRRKYECYAVCVVCKSVCRVQGQDLHALCCPLVQDAAMKMSDCPKKEAQWLVLSECTLCKRTAGILTAFRWGHSGWRSTRLPHCPSMKGSHWLTGGYWLEQNPHSIFLCLPTFPHLHLYHHYVCVSMRQGGGSGSPPGLKGLDRSLVSAVVAPAETHTVLLLVEQVRRLIGHGYGHRRGGGSGAGCCVDDSGGFQSVMEFCQCELNLSELTVCGLGCLVHSRCHHGVLVLLPRYLRNSENGVRRHGKRL